MRAIVLACAIALASCGAQTESAGSSRQATDADPPAAEPVAATADLSVCPERELLEEGLRERTRPIPVPTELSRVMRSSMDNFAVATLSGATVCIDASWMEQVSDAALSEDGRFVSFDWTGYEAFGHVIVDRSGKGTVIDTGVPPLRSPSGKRLAALDYSESGYGALNALAVWEILPTGLSEAAKLDTLPDLFGWRLDRWGTEACLELSGIAWKDVPDDAENYDTAPRRRLIARLTGRALTVEPAPEGGCPDA